MAKTPFLAYEQNKINAAYRAVDNPPALARAVRIVRAAIACGTVTPAELTPLPRSSREVSRAA